MFNHPVYLVLCLASVIHFLFASHRVKRHEHSSPSMHRGLKNGLCWVVLPSCLFAVFWISACIALAEPTVIATVTESLHGEVRDVLLGVDVSDSMRTPISDPGQSQTRANLAQSRVRDFVLKRQGDRVGLFYFSNSARFAWPLSTDIAAVEKQVARMDVFIGGGTNFDGPSQIFREVGALQAGIEHIRQLGTAKSKVFVLVTDGEAPFDRERFRQLSEDIVKLGIHFYVLGVGSDWTSGRKPILVDFAQSVNGKVFIVADANDFAAALKTVDSLEKSPEKRREIVKRTDLHQPFIILAVPFLLLSFLISAALLNYC